MNLITKLIKPYFIYHPEYIFKSFFYKLGFYKKGWSRTKTIFGGEIYCDNSEAIGRAIFKNGIYELPVSELLWRLLPKGGSFIDVGANIGYFSCLAANKIKGQGHILAYEPSDSLYIRLAKNLEPYNIVKIKKAAVSNKQGTAMLYFPADFESNNGIATLEFFEESSYSISVDLVKLDQEIAYKIDVLKVDVEGHELNVLEGARKILEDRRVDHIVFEDHSVESSNVTKLLDSFGYQIFSIGWDFHGVNIRHLGQKNPSLVNDAPNYIATLKPDVLLSIMAPRGWTVLNRHIKP